ncbi:FlgO family outer membrane protein [Colwellia sp. C1TZA3]|uniref:FlgO family outer membrane protein n=1 Tax=Colwellia sp. C1TZA3 TaxID=2508879 RepID=UPI0011B98F35|nr:FlgO family outer membrane protein [Colwellia sp. C1TZA3]TWX67485.1 hypothetical protein ESZ39_13410 [Colwellia sp. C1TZA3]
MHIFAKLLLIVFIPTSLVSCSSSGPIDTSRLCAQDNGDFYQCNNSQTATTPAKKSSTLFNTNIHFQLLSEYTEQMAADLEKDLIGVNIEQPVVVASFVYFDSTLQTSSALGNQLAEFFINDLQEIGLPVSDHKLTGRLDVNSQGDFALSRNIDDINDSIDIGYVLTGTMITNTMGIIVNVRLINFKTNRVAASASKFLPNIIVQSLLKPHRVK